MSVRLTVSFGAEDQAVINRLAELLKRVGVSIEMRHDVVDDRNGAVAKPGRDAERQGNAEVPLPVADCREAIEGQNRRPIVHRDGLYSAISGNLV